jgi:L-ribulose-5-phosphate 4-epimerase
MSAVEKAREDVMWAVKTICEKGYICATGGNFSARVEGTDQFVITPSSRPYDTMKKEDLCVVNLKGEKVEGEFKPSTEAPIHRLIFEKRPEVNGVIHMHSKFATAVACMEGVDGVPPFYFELLGYFGGPLPLAPFAPPGSDDLARVVVETMGKGSGVLMEHHGAVGVGKDIKDAMVKCDIIEKSCEMYLAILAVGKIKPLPQMGKPQA